MTDFISLSSKITADSDCSHEIKRHLLLGSKAVTNLDHVLKSRNITKHLYNQSYGFSSSYMLMWELDHKEGWAPKNWCFWIVVLEKTLESPLDSKEIKPVHPKGNQHWNLLEGLTLKLKLQYFGHLMQRANSLVKTLMLAGDWGQEEKGVTEDEMVGCHHWLSGQEFEQTPGDGEGQGSLACSSPRGRKESAGHNWVTEQ